MPIFVNCDINADGAGKGNGVGHFALVDFTNATLTQDGRRECVNTTGKQNQI